MHLSLKVGVVKHDKYKWIRGLEHENTLKKRAGRLLFNHRLLLFRNKFQARVSTTMSCLLSCPFRDKLQAAYEINFSSQSCTHTYAERILIKIKAVGFLRLDANAHSALSQQQPSGNYI